jgi:hypothetical protein
MTTQDVLDGRWIDGEAEFQQFTLNLIVPHPWVLTRDPENERLDVMVEPWSSAPVRLPKRPFAPDEFPMPLQHGFRLDEQNSFTQTLLPPLCLCLQTGGQDDEHQPFGT